MVKQWLMVTAAVTLLVAGIAFAGSYPDDLTQQFMAFKADGEAGKEMPAALEGVHTATTNEAYKMWKEKKAVILDCRPKSQYDTERIQGAELFIADDFISNPSMAEKLDKNKTYLLYCNGVKCWRSTSVALILAKHFGFKNIYWYRDGIMDWKKNSYPIE